MGARMETDPSNPVREIPAALRLDVPGGWHLQSVIVAGRRFELVGPAEPDQLLEELGEESGHTTSPYWGALWPAAIEFAEFMLRRRWPPTAAALELGCGLGLVGIAGLAAGLDVTFSDLVPLAVATAKHNALRHGLNPTAATVLDWRQPPLGRYAVAFGSDVLYDRELHAPLLDTLQRVLTPGGECWLGEPGRSTANSFVAEARGRGYLVQVLDKHEKPLPAPVLGEFQLLHLSSGAESELNHQS